MLPSQGGTADYESAAGCSNHPGCKKKKSSKSKYKYAEARCFLTDHRVSEIKRSTWLPNTDANETAQTQCHAQDGAIP